QEAYPRAPRLRAPLLPRTGRRLRAHRSGQEAGRPGLGFARSRASGDLGAAAAARPLHHRARVHAPAPGARPRAARRALVRSLRPAALAPDRPPPPAVPALPALPPRRAPPRAGLGRDPAPHGSERRRSARAGPARLLAGLRAGDRDRVSRPRL